MDQINYEDFAKVEFRIGEIVEAINVENSEKLIRLIVDFGSYGKKVVYSGIRKYYDASELVNKKTVFVVNMVPKSIMGENSEAMIFGAETEDSEKLSILLLEKEIPNGSRVI